MNVLVKDVSSVVSVMLVKMAYERKQSIYMMLHRKPCVQSWDPTTIQTRIHPVPSHRDRTLAIPETRWLRMPGVPFTLKATARHILPSTREGLNRRR